MKCYLCGSSDYKVRDGKVRDNEKLDVLECNHCGLVFLSSLEHIDENYYEDSNMSQGLDINEWLNETCVDDNRRFEFVKDMIINKDIVDFGSGAGGFLLKAKEVAKSVVGIELDNKIIEHYKKNNINHTADIESLENDRYDVITAFHVVEHLSNPIGILKLLVSKLKKGGKLIVEVPNSDDALLTIYKNKAFSNFTYWSPHLFLYNSKTLRLLFKKVYGVEIEFVKYIQRYPLSNHLYWLSHNKAGGHQKWGNFIDSPELTKAYEAQLSSLGATDTVIAQLIKR
ncbi:MAG: class I SAM-dependent methyltransferase [Sulfurimonas sp.]|uniref:class I SAM-dependent methyltransferase n=1 Tax=Sulfurimonas sp. TaxID=2022749 RepID=UPI0026137048|nr:class I SAM-dependent methyltransferase [Sulfurimonas sp.]MDD5372774.1 class I SAM-dependent methyltransferase [Sulfurimonas sp.]